MKRKPHSTSLVLLLVCIFTFWWGISVLTQSSAPTPVAITHYDPAVQSALVPLAIHETVDGPTHTYTGTFMPSNACDSFGSGIRYTSADGGHVSLLLITEPSTTQCAQAADLTGEPFSVSLKLSVGSRPAFDGVLLNGTHIPAELVESN
mgnify:CR=1 FL=1